MTGQFPRFDILPAAQQRLWPDLSPARKLGFVLYGGTAIALRLGHRQSVDFDFFSDHEFQPTALIRQFPSLSGATVAQEAPSTLTVLAPVTGSGGVKVSFFGGLTFGRLGQPDATPDGVMEVASSLDLLAHKLKVILQRVESKDYMDIDALVQSGEALAGGLAGAGALYPNFATQEALKALAYFEGGDLHLLPGEVRERLVRAASQARSVPPTRVLSLRLAG